VTRGRQWVGGGKKGGKKGAEAVAWADRALRPNKAGKVREATPLEEQSGTSGTGERSAHADFGGALITAERETEQQLRGGFGLAEVGFLIRVVRRITSGLVLRQ
jgi:hypothetical protein